MTSRNKREGFYGGKGKAWECVKHLSNGYSVWKLLYVRHARYSTKIFSLKGK